MHLSPGRRFRRWLTVAGAATAILLGAAAPARAYATDARIDLKLLVVTDGRANVEAVTAQLDREGVPYSLVDTRSPGRDVITAAFLSDTVSGQPRAKFQAVVLPHESALPQAELDALAAYENRFKIRHLNAYTWAHPGVGLNYATWGGTVDGMSATVTPAALAAGFGYLDGPLRFDDVDPIVPESYAALATGSTTLPAGATFTPFLSVPVPGGDPAAPAAPIGVYSHDGREEMVMTVSFNQFQTHARVLAHGVVEWLTRGIHFGHWRNYFSVHIDDVFLPDDRWHTEANCTFGDDCPAGTAPNTPIRMTAADVDHLVAWQNAKGIKLDMAFNGEGAEDAGAADPLTARLLAQRANLRWLNHTFGHPNLGCEQDFSVVPWRCATDANGQVRYASQAEIEFQISQNITWARGKGISLDSSELVTGEHSGLRSLPQMPVDNPNLAPALNRTGVRTIAADNSRDPQSRMIGNARTAPRHPMNIFYNVATKAEEVDEYNWIYTSAEDGGSGICTANPATSTCIEPLPGAAAFDSYIVPIEARIALGHVVSNDPRPHYAHQSNITQDRILYPVLDEILARYAATYASNTFVVNPKMAAVAEQLRRADAWRAAVTAGTVEAYLSGGRVTVLNRAGSGSLHMPVSMPNGTSVVTLSLLGIELLTGPYGESYAGGKSAWTSVPAGG
ncbi:MAG TPA: hypothetical protein VFT95_08880, partial [Micromonosporaceae bacterium]|nr:hypothetical protein [Micromonosporaceae bacterium]